MHLLLDEEREKHVSFANEETLASVGEWMRIIKLDSFFNILDKHELLSQMMKDKINGYHIEKIEDNFYKYLKSTDFKMDKKITVSLLNFGKESHIFDLNIHLDESDIDYKLNLKMGDLLDWPDEFTIIDSDKDIKLSYYQSDTFTNDPKIIKKSEVYKNGKNVYGRLYTGSYINIRVNNGTYFLKIDFDTNARYDDWYRLPNENKIREYLANLSFPANIDEVFNTVYKLAELDKGYIADYPYLDMSISEYLDDKYVESSVIEYEHGKQIRYLNSNLTAEQENMQAHLSKVDYAINHDMDVASVNDPAFSDNAWEEDSKIKRM